MTLYEKDQDTVKLAASLNPASKRHAGVWMDRRQEQLNVQRPPMLESPGGQTTTISPGRLGKADDIVSKRKEAAKWIGSLTHEAVPFSSDRDFRAALRNGVLLCKIMNEVAPGTIKVIHADDDVNNTMQRFEAVQSFMAAAVSMGVPQEYMLSMSDLESESNDDRPRVADCILWLKRLHGGSVPPSPCPLLQDTAPVSDSPRKQTQQALYKALHKTGAPQLATSISHSQSFPRGIHSSEQISNVQGMTALLKEKMAYNSGAQSTRQGGSYGHAVDAMGPLLENVLGNLTQEYERRLLSKDQEIQIVKDKLQGVQREMDGLHQAMATLRTELEDSQQQATVEVATITHARVQEYEDKVAALQYQLEEKESECGELQRQLDMSTGAVDEVRQQLEEELEDAREQLARAEGMTDSYRQIQEENKKLYNQVQDLRGAIRVFCRIRPAGRTGDNSDVSIDVTSDQELTTYCPKTFGLANQHHTQPKPYQFDRVFGESTTQAEIYADTQPLIRSVLDGYNVCIFAYGQTGSGKTHTMSGTDTKHADGRGINYRALDDLFNLRDKRSDEIEYNIQVQMLEIYNESLRDLLVDNPNSASNKLDILNTQASGCNVPGSTKIIVRDTEDVMDMMTRGQRNRHSAETKMNQRSSRSHQVLTIIVDGQSKVTGVKTHGCLHLIDLAGSERTDKSEVRGDRMTEANHINKSLSALGGVMNALATKQAHVPFRDSKLTQLLADSLSGQAKVMMFMHISPEVTSYAETSSTLQFAMRVASITLGEAKRNVESGEIHRSHEEILQLKDQVTHQSSEIQRLSELLNQANARAHMLEARAADQHQKHAHDTPLTQHTAYQSAGSLTAESRQPSALSFLSPAPNSQARGSLMQSPAMQTIREAPMIAMPPVTPSSARTSGVFTPGTLQQGATPTTAPRNGIPRPMSTTRESGRYGSGLTPNSQMVQQMMGGLDPRQAPVATPTHSGTRLPGPSPSGGSAMSRAAAKPPAGQSNPNRMSLDAGTGGLTKTSLPKAPAAPLAPKATGPPLPRVAALAPPSASARPGGMWGGGSVRASGNSVTPSAAGSAAVPASAGGRAQPQGGGRWGASKQTTPAGRWAGGK